MKKSLHMYLLVLSLALCALTRLCYQKFIIVPDWVAVLGIVVSLACLIASIVLWVRQGKKDEFYK